MPDTGTTNAEAEAAVTRASPEIETIATTKEDNEVVSETIAPPAKTQPSQEFKGLQRQLDKRDQEINRLNATIQGLQTTVEDLTLTFLRPRPAETLFQEAPGTTTADAEYAAALKKIQERRTQESVIATATKTLDRIQKLAAKVNLEHTDPRFSAAANLYNSGNYDEAIIAVAETVADVAREKVQKVKDGKKAVIESGALDTDLGASGAGDAGVLTARDINNISKQVARENDPVKRKALVNKLDKAWREGRIRV